MHLLAATGALVVSAGWFIALVALWPAASRPYIGGSTNNSLWELALGYNGLGRLLGSGRRRRGWRRQHRLRRHRRPPADVRHRLRHPDLLAAAGRADRAGRRPGRSPPRAPRTDQVRAGLLLWGGWLVATGRVFSFMSGTIHPYYAVALAPAIAGLVAVGGTELWRRRHDHLARGALAVMIGGTAIWGFCLMTRDAGGWQTWLAWTMLVGGVLGAVVLAVSTGALKKLAVGAALVGIVAALSGTASFTVATAATGHSGSIPMAGPSSVASSGLGGGMGGGTGQAPSRTGQTGTQTQTGTAPSSRGGGSESSAEVVTLLDATSTRWSAAVLGDQSAAGYILSTNTAVLAVGGWSGSDDAPTLAEFQRYVADGQISYFIAGGGMGGGRGQGGDTSSASQISAWVADTYTATTVGGVTVYDLIS